MENKQTAKVFAAELEMVVASAPPLAWRRPSDHDSDRVCDPLEPEVVVETIGQRVDAVGAGAMRGVILRKYMEELLTGEISRE